ncbi:MAG: hypothetical protein ACYTAS_17645, partial [Planctomycetota bacterium]
MAKGRYFSIVVTIVALCTPASHGEITIAKNGQANALIVVAAEATEAERHAAEELAQFLGQITGAEFALVDQAPRRQSCIFVGPDAAARGYRRLSADG